MLEADPQDLVVKDSRIFVQGAPARALTIADVATAVYRFTQQLPLELDAKLEASVRFRPRSHPTWSNATHLCVVEVDPETCTVEIVRYIVAEDCGPMINPQIVDGQICGGVVQGIGGVLLENFVYDSNGTPLTATLVDYLLPTTTEVPYIEVDHLATRSTSNPSGYKGVGEGGAIGAHAAVANAIGDALAHLGVRITATPLGPVDIHRLLVAAGLQH
jgi:carbon-monoxide dehydrogenase large subunit